MKINLNGSINYFMLQNDKNIYYTLRIAAAMCFIGHGSFGMITKEVWCNYFAVFGISHAMAFKLMPWLGAVDILMGLSLLIYPVKAVALWLVGWGFITAMLRPLSGEPIAEVIERGGNFGVPLALLILCSNGSAITKGLFSRISPHRPVSAETIANVTKCLRVVVFLLFVGHGWLNLIEKKGLMGQYTSLGFSNPALVAHIVGIFEVAAACMVLIRPIRPLLFALLVWKMGSELFYPHWELFEWIERGGSYGALLALWLTLPRTSLTTQESFATT
jgi:hypothetical protein